MAINYAAGGRLRKIRPEVAWKTIEGLAQYGEGWNDPIFLEEGSLNYKKANIEQLLGVMESRVNALMKDAISIMGRSEDVFGISSDIMYQLPLEPSRQEEFDHIVMNFILDQEERVKQLEEYMEVIMGDFMQLSSEVTRRLKGIIIEDGSRMRKIEKITRYLENEHPKPSSNLKFSETLTKSNSFHAPDFILPKSLCVKYVCTIFSSPPLVRESTFGFKLGTNNNQNVKSRYDVENSDPQSNLQVLSSFEEYTPPVTYPKGGRRDFRNPNRGRTFGRNTTRGFRMKEVDSLTIHTPPSPHMASFHLKDLYCYYHPCFDDPKKHYGFKTGLLGYSGSLGVDFLNFEMIEDDQELESIEVSFLGRILNLPV
ncbi:hypothetical protein Tco_0961281 [Tanacetum coccineum]